MTAQYSLNDLVYLMSRLRDPKDGCPWDLKQTFSSIVPHTLEEAYEVADAIEQQDFAHLKGELGDLLFQVIFYSQLGKEEGQFEFADVVHQLVEKLIRRHPHVFPAGTLDSRAGEQAVDEQQIKASWEAIKSEERGEKQQTKVLDDIPMALPALQRAVKLQKRASQVGFDWNNAYQVIDKIEEETEEVRQALAEGDEQAVIDEMGDLFFAQVNLARHLGVNPEEALRSTNKKFRSRFDFVESKVVASGKDWSAFSLNELDAFWDQAKHEGL